MEQSLYTWLYSLVLSGLICSIIMFLAQGNKVTALLETGCTCVMFLVLISPLVDFVGERNMENLFDQWSETISFDNSRNHVTDLTEVIIEQEYRAYILSEANQHGISLTDAAVETLTDSNGNQLPFSVTYKMDGDVPQEFRCHISQQLGIPEERQFTDENTRNRP